MVSLDDVTALPNHIQDGGCVTMATLWQQQHGGYMLFYIFNSTVVDWTCFLTWARSSTGRNIAVESLRSNDVVRSIETNPAINERPV